MYISIRYYLGPAQGWGDTEINVTLNQLFHALRPEHKMTNASQRTKLRTALAELEEKGLLKIKYQYADEYVIDVSNIIEQDKVIIKTAVSSPFERNDISYKEQEKINYYTMVDIEYLRNAFKDNNYNTGIFAYLFYYLGKKATNPKNRSDGENYYFMCHRYDMSEESGFDVRTIDKYNQILEKHYIIYVVRSEYKWISTGQQLPNLYGLYRDKESIDKYYNDYIDGKSEEIRYSPIIKNCKKEAQGDTCEGNDDKSVKVDIEKVDVNSDKKTNEETDIVSNKQNQKDYIYDWKSSMVLWGKEKNAIPKGNPFEDDEKDGYYKKMVGFGNNLKERKIPIRKVTF